jgi:hypothetical protein
VDNRACTRSRISGSEGTVVSGATAGFDGWLPVEVEHATTPCSPDAITQIVAALNLIDLTRLQQRAETTLLSRPGSS